jgi:N-acetylglucosamine kinase-like BadF-type ATPase
VRYYAGIDGGQSGTQAVIADETGHILARGHAGAADEVGQNRDSTRLRDALSGALADALQHASLDRQTQFDAIAAGISGYEGRVYGQEPELPARSLALVHDTVIAHAGALAGETGVVVIAGTGSVAYAAGASGETALVGGWGYLFGDEGSAFGLARDALSRAMRDTDAGRASSIADLALAHFSVSELRKLSRSFYTGGITRAQIAGFAQALIESAERGDALAVLHVQNAAQALAQIAKLAAASIRLESPAVAFTGGMMRSGTMRELTAEWLQAIFPQARRVEPRHDPASGALLLAYKAAGMQAPTLRG